MADNDVQRLLAELDDEHFPYGDNPDAGIYTFDGCGKCGFGHWPCRTRQLVDDLRAALAAADPSSRVEGPTPTDDEARWCTIHNAAYPGDGSGKCQRSEPKATETCHIIDRAPTDNVLHGTPRPHGYVGYWPERNA